MPTTHFPFHWILTVTKNTSGPDRWSRQYELDEREANKKGWYWWRQDKEAVICRVWEWWDKQELYVRFEGSDSVPVTTLDGEWAGPVDPPT